MSRELVSATGVFAKNNAKKEALWLDPDRQRQESAEALHIMGLFSRTRGLKIRGFGLFKRAGLFRQDAD